MANAAMVVLGYSLCDYLPSLVPELFAGVEVTATGAILLLYLTQKPALAGVAQSA